MIKTITNKTFVSIVAITTVILLSFSFSLSTVKAQNADVMALLLAAMADGDISQSEIVGILAALGGSDTTGDSNQNQNSSSQQCGVTEEFVHHPNIDYEFTQSMRLGTRSDEVLMLQKVLNANPATRIATTGVGSPGNETNFFGPKTKTAVQAFQAANNVSPASGFVGPLTRAELNRTTTTTVACEDDDEDEDDDNNQGNVEGDKLVISGTASDDRMAGKDQTVIISEITLEAGDEDVRVRNIEVEYSGSANESNVIDRVILLDSSMLEIDQDGLDSRDEASLRADKIVEEGESVTMYIAVRTKTFTNSSNGLDATITVTGVTTNGADVEGTPIEGAIIDFHDSFDVGNFDAQITQEESGSVRIGEEEVRVATINIENNSNDDDEQTVKSLKLERTGSTGDNDLDNVEIRVDGETFEATQDDEHYTFVFEDGITLSETGDDLDFVLYTDIEDGSSETFAFKITDVVVVDEDDVILSDTTVGAGNWSYTGDVTIELSQVTISSTNDVQSDRISAGQDDTELASFEVEVTGKDVEGDLEVTITVQANIEDADGVLATGTNVVSINDIELDNLTIYTKDGDRISDREDTSFSVTPVDSVIDQATYIVTFNDVIFKADDDAIEYVIKGDINRDAPTNTKYEITNLKYVSIQDTDGEDIDFIDEAINTPAQMEVEAAAVTVEIEAPNDTDINSDTHDVIVAEIKIDTDNSGDDVTVSQVKLGFALENLAEVTTLTLSGTAAAGTLTVNLPGGLTEDLTLTVGNSATQVATQLALEVNANHGAVLTATSAAAVVTITNDVTEEIVDVLATATAHGISVATATTTQGSGATHADLRSCQIFDGSSSVSDRETAASSVTYNLEDVTVTKNTQKTLMVKCNVGSDFNNNNEIRVTLTEFDARGDHTNARLDTDSLTTNTLVTVTKGSASVKISTDDANDDKLVQDNANGVILGHYEFKADDAALTIDDITVTFSADVSAEIDGRVEVYIDGNREDTSNVTNTATFTNLAELIAKNKTVIVEFRADMAVGGTDNIQITGLTMTTEEAVPVTVGTIAGPTVTVKEAVPVVTEMPTNTITMATSSESDRVVMKFSVKASGGDVQIDSLGVVEALAGGMSLANRDIRVYSNSSLTTLVQEDLNITAFNNAGMTDVIISDGNTYYFVLEADITVTGASSGTITMPDATGGIVFSPALDSSLVMTDEFKTTINTAL